MQTKPLSQILEGMTCLELAYVVRLQSAIHDAQRAGLDGWEMSLRDELNAFLNTKA